MWQIISDAEGPHITTDGPLGTRGSGMAGALVIAALIAVAAFVAIRRYQMVRED